MTITNAQRLTLLACLAVTVGILLWDWFLLRDGVPGNTISGALKSASECIPIPLLWGILLAHLFWYQPGPADQMYAVHRIVAFVAVVVASYVWWEASSDPVRLWLSARPHLVVPVGYAVGHLVWPQYAGSVGA